MKTRLVPKRVGAKETVTGMIILGVAVISFDAIMVGVDWPLAVLIGIGVMALTYVGEVLFSVAAN